ncbi:type I methionyl aminopeptidase [Candidatus Latescibacterota bacterium]
MIAIRTDDDVTVIRSACRLAAEAMEIAKKEIQPGVTTRHISGKVQEFIEGNGAKAAFLGYNGYPGAICVSVNEEVVHGIPGDRVLVEGDLVKLDIGTYKDGFYGDMARSYPVGEISPEAEALAKTAKRAFYEGITYATAGNRIGDIGYAIQSYVEKLDYGVVRALVGHGIGRNLHEDPQVPNFGKRGAGPILRNGMVLAIEPMITMKRWEVNVLSDDWTVVTSDGELSAHYENTCVIRDNTPEILTLMNGE